VDGTPNGREHDLPAKSPAEFMRELIEQGLDPEIARKACRVDPFGLEISAEDIDEYLEMHIKLDDEESR
jgi:hypothetical protein